MGMVTMGLISVAAVSAILLFALMLPAGLTSIGLTALFFGFAFACGLVAPSALRLSGWGSAEPQESEANLDRATDYEESTSTPTKSVLDEKHAERQLLEAIRREGQITPIKAALETTLTVAEADRLLSDLAKGGHLEVHVEEGRLLYSL